MGEERGEGVEKAVQSTWESSVTGCDLKNELKSTSFPPPAPPKKERRERLQVRRNRMCESLIQKPWELIHLGTRNFSQSESLRILLLWKALQAVLWLTWFLIATGGELLVILFISRDFTQSPSLLCDISHMLQTSSGSAFVMNSNASQQLSLPYTFFLNWRAIALQYCVGLCRTSSWIS